MSCVKCRPAVRMPAFLTHSPAITSATPAARSAHRTAGTGPARRSSAAHAGASSSVCLGDLVYYKADGSGHIVARAVSSFDLHSFGD